MPSVVRRFKLCSGWLDFPFALVSTESGGHCRSRRPPGEVTVGKIRPEQSLKVLGCGRFRKIENSSLKDFPARDSATVVLGPLRGHRRLQANRGAEALGRAEAVLWPMKEAAAVLPDRSLRLMDPGPGKSHPWDRRPARWRQTAVSAPSSGLRVALGLTPHRGVILSGPPEWQDAHGQGGRDRN
jgi:hypothetical protein